MKSISRFALAALAAVTISAVCPAKSVACERQPLRNLARAVAQIAVAPVQRAAAVAQTVREHRAERVANRLAEWRAQADFPPIIESHGKEVFVSDPPFPASAQPVSVNTSGTAQSCTGPGCQNQQSYTPLRERFRLFR